MVESRFLSAVVALGASSKTAMQMAYADLELRYRGRPYHNLRHIEATLATYLFLAEDLGPAEGAPVVLALCYHDAVYDPRSEDNEAKSAELARASLSSLGIQTDDLKEIERLIRVTRDHRAEDVFGALVVDADLAILQTTPEEYDYYAAAIREEYAFVPDREYRVGRTRVLEGLRSRDGLFFSPLMDEAAARANVQREISNLKLWRGSPEFRAS